MTDEKRQQGGPDAGDGEAEAGGNTLQDASDEAVREMKDRAEGTGHAGAGDIG